MTEWKTYKLGDVADITTGFPFKGDLYSKNGIRVLRGENIGDEELRWDGHRDKRWNMPFERINEYSLQDGDVILAMDGNVGKNKARITDKDLPMLIAQRVACIRANTLSDQKFLYYAIISRAFQQYLDSVKTGTTIQHISMKQIADYEISLPGLEEQRRIAGILSAIDDKIENNRRINDNLEQQAQALYKQWFVDFDFPNEDGKPYKSSGGKMVDSELGQIPEGWSVGDIYKYVNVVYGAPYKSVLFNERKDGNPLIRIRDLKTFSPQYYTQEILPNTEYVNAGDVVAGMDAEFVPCLWMGEKGVLNQRCCKFVGKQDSISNYYVMFLVKSELEFVQSYKTGTTVSHLGKADIDKFIVVQPPFAVIEKFSKIADALLNNKIKLAKENITLATLRDTLLPKLMNGEIKL